ncbi:MAG: DpnI domain-containing protein [Terriglobia bacterium]
MGLATGYRSPCQRARVISEAWGRSNLYCPRCDSPRLEPSRTNTRAVDFVCPKCAADFQLKSQSRPFSRRITDSAYGPMRCAIEKSRTPHFFTLHYDSVYWRVRNLTLVPSFALTLSCLEKRKPLAFTARRSGWVGCNILLFKIPLDARIPVVAEGRPSTPASVRERYSRLQPLEGVGYEKRGWTLDVLNVVRSLQKRRFHLTELYGRSEELQLLHPGNLHTHEKIRQQLQRLRDMGLLEFSGGGRYLLK